MSAVEDVMIRLAKQVAREADEHAKTQALIIEAYTSNRTLRDIAAETGLSHESIRQILAKAGIPIRARGRIKAVVPDAQPGT
jgi:DNA-directed RNA polymerase specialized sigma subunit